MKRSETKISSSVIGIPLPIWLKTQPQPVPIRIIFLGVIGDFFSQFHLPSAFL